MTNQNYRICLNISPGLYFLPGFGDSVSKVPEVLENDHTNLTTGCFLACFSHPPHLRNIEKVGN